MTDKTETGKVDNDNPVAEKISGMLEERRGERRNVDQSPTYINPDLDRRKSERRST